MNHTPGPWTNDTEYFAINHPAGDDPNACNLIAHYARKPDGSHVANARLIAAAPELLEALQESSSGLLEWMSNHNDEVDETDDNLLAKIAAAIAKATT